MSTTAFRVADVVRSPDGYHAVVVPCPESPSGLAATDDDLTFEVDAANADGWVVLDTASVRALPDATRLNILSALTTAMARAQRPATAGGQGPPPDADARSRPIRDLELSVRARKCMAKFGIQTVGDLVAYTGAELLAGKKNFGQYSLAEVRDQLARYNLKLRGD